MMVAERSDLEHIIVGGRKAALRWRRNARARRVALRINPSDGQIVITLPPRASRRSGMALLRAHEGWVAAKLEALPSQHRFVAGGTVPISGIPHRIVHDVSFRGSPLIAAGTIIVGGEPVFLPRRVRDALVAIAKKRFFRQALAKAEAIGRRPTRIRIKDTVSRWGSCTPDGSLMFCWRLVMAPDFVQDYVISHEVAHLREMNHGHAFWALTERLTPHRNAATDWLAQHGQSLLRIG